MTNGSSSVALALEPLKEPRPAAFPWGRYLRQVLPGLTFCTLLILSWELMARWLHSPLVPGVEQVASETFRIVASGDAVTQISITLWRIVLGFLLAFSVALPIGIASARFSFVHRFFEPAIVLGLTVPGLVWALLCVIWFGVSLATPVVSVALGIAPALILQVIQGVKSVDPDIVEMAHVYRLSRGKRLSKIWLPSLVPYLLSGARIGFSLAWKVIVLVEIFGLSDGVGYRLNSEFSMQNVEGVLAWTLSFWVGMVTLEYVFFQALERRLSYWERKARV
ncbi:MAG: nitrate ABC transporter permease [Curvibacter sp. PD_MW3]|nr:MAG: nitrate ABC transporter permease [Curvibacter sp. PD_MW3]